MNLKCIISSEKSETQRLHAVWFHVFIWQSGKVKTKGSENRSGGDFCGGSFNTRHGKRAFGRTRELFCILLVMAGTWFLRLSKCFNLKIYEIKNKGKWSWAGTDPLLLCSSFTSPSAIPRDKSEPRFLGETEQGGTGLVFPDSTPLYFYNIRSFQFIYSFS